MFNERKVVGFTNELKRPENDILFDLTFEDQIEAKNSENVVKIDIKEEALEVKIKPEVLVDEENSSSSETDNHI